MTEDGSNFYTNEGYKLASSSGKNVYIKGGEDMSSRGPIKVPIHGYTWTQKANYEYKEKAGYYVTLDEAYKYCSNDKTCLGITKTVSQSKLFLYD